ncbi:MarR family winged helix-turn-helix transcriptional regulator [Streptomyces sp. NPDC003996]
MKGGRSLIERWNRLDRLHRRIETCVERRLQRQLGLSGREFHALSILHARASAAVRPLHLSDLAAETGLSQSATSRLVSRLQDRGLISTRSAAHDRRSVDLRLTPVAHEVLRRGTPLLDQAVHHAVRALSADDTDRDLLHYLNGPTAGVGSKAEGHTPADGASC